jgi:hypothetical protein
MKATAVTLRLFLIIVIFLAIATAVLAENGVVAVGTIKKQGITIYMYGTHILMNDEGRTLYALRSKIIKLDEYIGKKVMVKGSLIEGYPVDFGPDYLDVNSVDP